MKPLSQSSKRLRRSSVFWVFILSTVPLTALLIAYAAGYKIDKQTGAIFTTSVLSITTEPNDARVFVNGIEQQKTTPYMNNNLLPGEYTIELQKEGYYSWKKQLTIEEDKSVVFSDILLFAKHTPVQQTAPTQHIEEKNNFAPLSKNLYPDYKKNGWSHPESLTVFSGPVDIVIDPKQHVSYITSVESFNQQNRIEHEIQDASWYQDRLLLYNTGRELWVYNAHAANEVLTHQLLIRQSAPINTMVWHPEGSSIVYGDDTGLYAIELDNRDHYQTWKLSDLPHIKNLSINSDGTEVSFWSKKKFYTLQIN